MRYRVSGDIVTGAFVTVVEADSVAQAEIAVAQLPVTFLHNVSTERARPVVDSVEEMAEGEEL
jgi:hypothetical protein